MNNVNIRPLGNISIVALTESWNAGFGDYKVNLQMTEGSLQSFMNQNGVQLRRSVGAFDGDNLVGFWLNGVRSVNGVSTAYDSGTAIHPEFRGGGISGLMATESNVLLKDGGVMRYTLEVMKGNTRARDVYIKDGFEVTRELICFKSKMPLNAGNFSDSDDGIVYSETKLDDSFWNSLPKMEYQPSWQNSEDAVRSIGDQMRAVTAQVDGKIIGYAILQTTRGRIPQIGVDKEYWDSKVASNLLIKLCEMMETGAEVMIINVDVAAPHTIALFEKMGFAEFVRSLEMKRAIG